MLELALFSQIFTYCSDNLVYDAPNGSIVRNLPEKFMVSISDLYHRYGRFQHKNKDWTAFLMTDYNGKVIDENIYWLKSDGCWGVFVGR